MIPKFINAGLRNEAHALFFCTILYMYLSKSVRVNRMHAYHAPKVLRLKTNMHSETFHSKGEHCEP